MNPVLTLETTAYTLEQLISLAEPQIDLTVFDGIAKLFCIISGAKIGNTIELRRVDFCISGAS